MLAQPQLAMLHSALATAPGRPMVPVAAVVASLALTGAALLFTARALTASSDPPAHRAVPAAAHALPAR